MCPFLPLPCFSSLLTVMIFHSTTTQCTPRPDDGRHMASEECFLINLLFHKLLAGNASSCKYKSSYISNAHQILVECPPTHLPLGTSNTLKASPGPLDPRLCAVLKLCHPFCRPGCLVEAEHGGVHMCLASDDQEGEIRGEARPPKLVIPSLLPHRPCLHTRSSTWHHPRRDEMLPIASLRKHGRW